MIAVLQRVYKAKVTVEEKTVGTIDHGLYILLGVEATDTQTEAAALAEKILKLRIFCDKNEKMNLSVKDVHGDILVVSNFTLCANYAHGNRPDYLAAARPEVAEPLYQFFSNYMKTSDLKVENGVFGADMTTEMTTEGPVTICMNSDVLLRKNKAEG